MPNRILKESICSSENVDALSIEAETFFYRLIVQCDDYGRMDARASILRAKCFPLRLDKVNEKNICAWVRELEDAGLVVTYSVKGHAYLHFVKWDSHQQIRAKRSKYPDPQAADNNLQASEINGNHVSAYVPVIQSNPIESNIAGEKTPASESDPVKELAAVFEQSAGIKLADIPKKEQGANFWGPLKGMYNTANKDSPGLMRAAIEQMRRDGLTIYSPKSVVKVFTSLHGKKSSSSPNTFKDYS